MNQETNVINVSENFEASPSDTQVEMNADTFSKLKKVFVDSSLTWQILKLILYAAFGIGIYVLLFSPRIMTMTKYSIEESIVNDEKVVINKDIRGIFPPLNGNQDDLVRKWSIKSGQKFLKDKVEIQDKYILQFKWNKFIYLMRSKCNGDLRLTWKSYFNNIVIKRPKLIKSEGESMVIPNLLEDQACILQHKQFIQKLLNASIWTTYEGNLYLLLQDLQDPRKPNEMLIFQQARD